MRFHATTRITKATRLTPIRPAQIQIWKADYAAAFPAGTAGERFVDFAGRHFKVLRDFPQDFDTQTLILTEVIR